MVIELLKELREWKMSAHVSFLYRQHEGKKGNPLSINYFACLVRLLQDQKKFKSSTDINCSISSE